MLFALFMVLVHSAVAVEIAVEPDPPVLNESFRLTFTTEGTVFAQPDFSPLEDQLDILSRNRHTSIRTIDGQRVSTTSWTLSVMARAAGPLHIPSIAFGPVSSPARTIHLEAADAADGAAPEGGVARSRSEPP